MKRYVSMLVAVGFILGPAMLMAQEKKEHKEKAAGEKAAKVEAPLQDLTLTGKITKEEKAGKEGKAAKVTYTLTTTDGVAYVLPEAKKAKEGAAAIKLDDNLNADVKVVAKGREMDKDGKKIVHVVEIVSIEKVVAPAK